MLKQCEQRKMYSHLYKHDLSSGLPVEISDQYFDTVFAVGCLEFVENHRALFKEVYNHLVDDGEFLFTVQASSSKLPELGYNQFSNGEAHDYFYIIAKRL